MCNAWNHPIGCDCGWGTDASAVIEGGVQPAFSSYINPNATCPVCGVQVFFYQSPDGGRVFFDELGPPWPKHACTDNSDHRYSRPPVAEGYLEKRDRWAQDGWLPLRGIDLQRHGAGFRLWGRVLRSGDDDGVPIQLDLSAQPHGLLVEYHAFLPLYVRALSRDFQQAELATISVNYDTLAVSPVHAVVGIAVECREAAAMVLRVKPAKPPKPRNALRGGL